MEVCVCVCMCVCVYIYIYKFENNAHLLHLTTAAATENRRNA